LTPPLTESEWRNMNQQLKKQLNNANTNTHDTNATTTVNPRERPKASLNPANTILALPQNSAKLTLSIKPPIATIPQHQQQQQQQHKKTNQIGFDDDFSTLNPTSTVSMMTPQQQTSNIPTSSSTDFMHESTVDLQQKKSHRRSASQ
jgi:hypothetical protein